MVTNAAIVPWCTCRTQDNRLFVAALPKATHGEHWRRLFRGDPRRRALPAAALPPGRYFTLSHAICLLFLT